jgi:quercetin dioxygenase-like cupin family protein
VPKLYFASPRDLPPRQPTTGLTERVIAADHATVAVTELAPKTVVETHKHDVEQIGVVTKGSLVVVVAGEQRILSAGDTYRIPAGAAHGARAFEEPVEIVDVWAPTREDLRPAGAGRTRGRPPR